MKRLFWIGSPFFSSALSACGWDVCAHNFEHTAVFGWDEIRTIAGWEPDVVVVADKSRPPFVVGMERFPCLTVFYCVDSHIHSWYPQYAQGFDICLMSLRDHMGSMCGEFLPRERIWWSPAFAKDEDQPGQYAPRWDALFVGTVHPETTPKRHALMRTLQSAFPGLHVTRGNYRDLYPKARLVLNHCEAGDLNFRVFEALGCGACLLTPDVGHGQDQLFTAGVDLLTYPADAPDTAAAILKAMQHALSDEGAMRRMAASGLAKINAEHRAQHRAQAFTRRIRSLEGAALVARRMENARAIRTRALRLIYLLLAESVASPVLKGAYLAAASDSAD